MGLWVRVTLLTLLCLSPACLSAGSLCPQAVAAQGQTPSLPSVDLPPASLGWEDQEAEAPSGPALLQPGCVSSRVSRLGEYCWKNNSRCRNTAILCTLRVRVPRPTLAESCFHQMSRCLKPCLWGTRQMRALYESLMSAISTSASQAGAAYFSPVLSVELVKGLPGLALIHQALKALKALNSHKHYVCPKSICISTLGEMEGNAPPLTLLFCVLFHPVFFPASPRLSPGTAVVAAGLGRALRLGRWSRLVPAMSGTGQLPPLFTEEPPAAS